MAAIETVVLIVRVIVLFSQSHKKCYSRAFRMISIYSLSNKITLKTVICT